MLTLNKKNASWVTSTFRNDKKIWTILWELSYHEIGFKRNWAISEKLTGKTLDKKLYLNKFITNTCKHARRKFNILLIIPHVSHVNKEEKAFKLFHH